MIEKSYEYTIGNVKKVEKIIADDNLNINHMILPKGDFLPEHYAGSNVYMTVVRGTVSLLLDDQPEQRYEIGKILNIPYGTKMNVCNNDEEVLEFFVVKAPAPKNYTE